MEDISKLSTEQQNWDTRNIDLCSTEEILYKINKEDQKIADVVKKQIPNICVLVDAAYEVLRKGGKLIYAGAGTSGRLGILDASECPPTYGVSAEMIQGVMAGGNEAIFSAREGVEDLESEAVKDLKTRDLTENDMVIGIAASGRTPYVIGALKYANEIGAKTGSICCVEKGIISSYAKYPIEVMTGPEVICGSTRMKAGTAQKMILNMISTTVMIKLGKVYQNYMVDVQPTNQKLEKRACNMIKTLLDINDDEAFLLYEKSGKNVKTAIAMGMLKIDKQKAFDLLKQADGHLSTTLKQER